MCTCLCILLAFFCPPLAVLCWAGCTGQFWLNCVLTLLLYIPGIVHAIWVISTYEVHHVDVVHHVDDE